MDLLLPLGFAGAVLVMAALAAGFVDRAPLSFPALSSRSDSSSVTARPGCSRSSWTIRC